MEPPSLRDTSCRRSTASSSLVNQIESRLRHASIHATRFVLESTLSQRRYFTSRLTSPISTRIPSLASTSRCTSCHRRSHGLNATSLDRIPPKALPNPTSRISNFDPSRVHPLLALRTKRLVPRQRIAPSPRRRDKHPRPLSSAS